MWEKCLNLRLSRIHVNNEMRSIVWRSVQNRLSVFVEHCGLILENDDFDPDMIERYCTVGNAGRCRWWTC